MVDKPVLVTLGVDAPSLHSCGSASQVLLGGRSSERDEEVPVLVSSPLKGMSSRSGISGSPSEEFESGLSLK